LSRHKCEALTDRHAQQTDVLETVIRISYRAAPDETVAIAASEVRRIPDVKIVVR
jgi:hypothetical protein